MSTKDNILGTIKTARGQHFEHLCFLTLKYLDNVHIVSASTSIFLKYSCISGNNPGKVPPPFSFSNVSAPPVPRAGLPLENIMNLVKLTVIRIVHNIIE